MTPVTAAPDLLAPSRPFPGIASFGYADHHIFFARGTETQKLLRSITIYRSLLLFGASGAGKSSLINAGVIPGAIAEGFSPERIRVQPRLDEEIIVERIPSGEESKLWLPSALTVEGEDGPRVVLPALALKERLTRVGAGAYPLLIFDQFEEFVSLFEEAPRDDALRQALVAQQRVRDLLIALARDAALSVKILYVFREDYLAKLGKLFAQFPNLLDTYVSVTAPTVDELDNIIRGPFRAFPDRFHPPLSDAVITRLTRDLSERSEAGKLNLSEVQIACQRLWEAKNRDVEYERGGLQGLLEGSLSDSLSALPRDVRDSATALLARMVTDEGLRNVISRDDLLARAHQEEKLGLDVLEKALGVLETNTGLVRRERRHDVVFYEIVSEFLVPWIRAQRILRDADRQRRRALWRIVIPLVLLLIAVVGGAAWVYRTRTTEALKDQLVIRAQEVADAAQQRAENAEGQTVVALAQREIAEAQAERANRQLTEAHTAFEQERQKASKELAQAMEAFATEKAELLKENAAAIQSLKAEVTETRQESNRLTAELERARGESNAQRQTIESINARLDLLKTFVDEFNFSLPVLRNPGGGVIHKLKNPLFGNRAYIVVAPDVYLVTSDQNIPDGVISAALLKTTAKVKILSRPVQDSAASGEFVYEKQRFKVIVERPQSMDWSFDRGKISVVPLWD